MKFGKLFSVLSILTMSAGVAQAGDAAKGESDFKRCKACHTIVADDGTVIVKGGRTGPNLYGLIGKTVGTAEDFKYSASLAAAGEAGIVWDEEKLAAWVTDPKAWLVDVLDDPKARTNMTFKLRKGGEDMAAYLATLGGEAPAD
ncbi:c-type cytochrome [Roseovarius sp. ZX-A-9]|uniref:c-type cytochrome n=1 Tax=Roseovarius sp. ZX-A-9 TaxID=3014783 RepID=UPI00232AE7CD|nr:cytochrome C [Roseovarius sp. ZX-A-9]